MRKSFNGLLALVKGVLEEDPLSSTWFVFINRRRNYIKAVYWDRTGFCLYAKRLERGRFALPGSASTQILSLQVFQLVLDGIVLGNARCLR